MKNILSWTAFNEELAPTPNRVPVKTDANKPTAGWTARIEDFVNPQDLVEMKKVLASEDTNESYMINEGFGVDIVNKILTKMNLKGWVEQNKEKLKQSLPELQRLKNLGFQGFVKEMKTKIGNQPVTESAEQVKQNVGKVFGALGSIAGVSSVVLSALTWAGIFVLPFSIIYVIAFAIICGIVYMLS